MEDKFDSLMAGASLSRYTDDIRGLIRNSIRIISQPVSESDFEIGQSRMGGLPDLPPRAEWPVWMPPVYPRKPGFFERLFSKQPPPSEEPKLSPHSFIAQFNLSEVSPYDIENVLPDRGMLYFFFDTNPMVWSDDPPHSEGWRVTYWNGDASRLTRASTPKELPQRLIYGTFRPTFTSERVFPPSESLLLERLGMSQNEIYQYAEVIEKLSSYDNDQVSRLLGHPDYIQYTDMLTECQLASNGIAAGDLRQLPNDTRIPDLLERAIDWQLLFQMDSRDMNTNWGDAGRIYYFTKSYDMTQQSLDEVQLVLQCG
ncbi:MAG: YwqG family protein [Armatimonadota bacterium]|nr:DUF1963 domain-containing protein [bacterium]